MFLDTRWLDSPVVVEDMLQSILHSPSAVYIFPDTTGVVELSKEELTTISEVLHDINNITDTGFEGESDEYV